MERLTITLDEEHRRALSSLAASDRGRSGTGDAALAALAVAVLDEGIALRLGASAAIAAPSIGTDGPSAVEASTEHVAVAPASSRPVAPDSVKFAAAAMAAVALIVTIVGGYGDNWRWTGFPANPQLWNWLELLLLPLAFASLPLWLRYGSLMGRRRTVVHAAIVVAFGAFVAAGYLAPLNWTGFRGNTLWDWITLLILPVTLVTIQAWPTSGRQLRPRHLVGFSLAAIAWAVTLVGGYAFDWAWTGYGGNTLWDWLQLLLVPLVFPIVVLPKCLRWAAGDVERLEVEMHTREVEVKRDIEEHLAGSA